MPSAFQAREFAILSVGLGMLFVGVLGRAAAQPIASWNAPVETMFPGPNAYGGRYGGDLIGDFAAPPQPVRPRGPLARLVRNRDMSAGLPPYALADQAGVIQRYVEPVPGINLNAHIGSVVVVRHDTGQTLLASQLELPTLPLDTTVDDLPNSRRARRAGTTARRPSGVQRAQFVDDDDSTVELLSEDPHPLDNSRPLPEGEVDQSEATIEAIPNTGFDGAHHGFESDAPGYGGSGFDGETWSEELPPGAGPSFSQPFSDPMYGDGMGPDFAECHPGGECCPHCQGGSSLGGPMIGGPMMGSGMMGGRGDFFGLRRARTGAQQCEFFADVQFNFLRLHLMEDAAGKLSEKYELSPRFVLGFEGGEISDGRVRYWSYGRDTPRLRGGKIRVDFDVLDIEATQRFRISRSDIVVGAGFRMAAIEVEDVNGDDAGADLLGMTVAADAVTHICRLQQGRLAWVFGGRLSILGGDWGGDESNDFIDVPTQDDNVITDELFGGIEYSCRYQRVNLRARLAFEMQNWHSDVFAQQAGTDSIGFLGPGVHVGAQF